MAPHVLIQLSSIYPCSHFLLLARFTEAFCFYASSSSFLKICQEKVSANGIQNADPWVQMGVELVLQTTQPPGPPQCVTILYYAATPLVKMLVID